MSKSRESWTNLVMPIALILGFVLLLSLNVGEAVKETATSNRLEEWLELVVGYATAVGEIAAALVIGIAVVRSIVAYLRQLVARQDKRLDSIEMIRLRLGRALILGLEFTVASDILRTAIAPTRQEILNLGAIILLRTLLNYVLEHEIRQGEESRIDEGENHQAE